jgi:hypothetical protein
MSTFIQRVVAGFRDPSRGRFMIEIAELLDLDASNIEALRCLPVLSLERNEIFVSMISPEHGGVLDWRDDIGQIYDLLESCLSPEQYALLPERTTIFALTLGKKVLELSHYLEKSGIALRLIESLGDSYYLIIVPIVLVAKFDDIAKKRAVDAA